MRRTNSARSGGSPANGDPDLTCIAADTVDYRLGVNRYKKARPADAAGLLLNYFTGQKFRV